METKTTINQEKESDVWTPPLPPQDLIFDDGEPMESNRHRIAMNTLIHSLQQYWSERNDYFVGGNMFIYYSSQQVRNEDFKGPDFFVVLNVPEKPTRKAWIAWEENGRYPDVIIELLSPSTYRKDLGENKEIYQNIFKTKDYFVYNPFEPNSLQGWELDKNQYYQEKTPNSQGRLWSEVLGLWLGTCPGVIQKENADWLRFYDENGNLVLLPEEAERQEKEFERQRAETERQEKEFERQRAERLAAKLRELGYDPDNI
jgi:Uma2 family endonuclease